MAITVTHTKVSGVADGADPAQVQPSDWNDGHVVGGTIDVPDPLTIGVINITDHESFGAAPSESGRIRLSNDEYITARDVFTGTTDIQLLGLDASDVIGIGLYPGNVGSTLKVNPGSGKVNIFDALGNMRVLFTPDDVGYDTFGLFDAAGTQRATIGYEGGQDAGDFTLWGPLGQTLLDFNTLGDSLTFSLATENEDLGVEMAMVSGAVSLALGRAGATLALSLLDLPATDPAVAGQVFTMDSAGLAAALAAGARYLLISGGP